MSEGLHRGDILGELFNEVRQESIRILAIATLNDPDKESLRLIKSRCDSALTRFPSTNDYSGRTVFSRAAILAESIISSKKIFLNYPSKYSVNPIPLPA